MSDTAGPRLITKRLLLEMPRPAKASRVLEYLTANRARFLDSSPSGPPLTLELVAATLSSAISEYETGRGMKLYMFLRAADLEEPIGDIALSEIVRGPFQACYLGYRIGAEYEGRGYVTESVARDYLHLNGEWRDHVLTSRINPDWRVHL